MIDLGVVGLISTIVWRTQLIAFPITTADPITGNPIFDATQQARLDDIAESLNTSFTRNNTLYVLDQSGFVLTALAAIVMFVLVFVLIPANVGWSPGKKLLSLAVVDADGNNPSLVAHAKRTAAGIIDVLPIVLPGLAGWIIANTHEYRQRLGDRIAGTYVIDNRVGAKFIDPSVYARRRELRRAATGAGAGDNDEMVQIGDRLGGSPSGLHRPEPEPVSTAALPALPPLDALPPDTLETDAPPIGALPNSTPPTDAPPLGNQPTTEAIASLASNDLPADDEIDLSHLANIGSHPVDLPPIDPRLADLPAPNLADLDPPMADAAPLPTTPSGSVAPAPSHRFAVDADAPTNELGFVEADQPGLGLNDTTGWHDPVAAPPPAPSIDPPLPTLDDTTPLASRLDDLDLGRSPATSSAPPPTHRGLDAADHSTPEHSAPDDIDLPDTDAQSIEVDEPESDERRDEPTWEQPVPEPAPVWEPFAERTPSHRESPVDDATTGEHELATTPAASIETPDTTASSNTPAADGLVWNEQWQAWLFWDAEHEHWLRHDIANDRWIPIS
ncbi:MAG: RDD family protein [Acidimicrobiales bacterium]